MLDVAVALVFRDGRLLFQRRDREPMLGAWELPGGKMQPGEGAVEAAVRELREETGLTARRAVALAAVLHEYDWGRVRLHAVEVEAEGEASGGRWLAAAEWNHPSILPGTRALIQTLFPGGVTRPRE